VKTAFVSCVLRHGVPLTTRVLHCNYSFTPRLLEKVLDEMLVTDGDCWCFVWGLRWKNWGTPWEQASEG